MYGARFIFRVNNSFFRFCVNKVSKPKTQKSKHGIDYPVSSYIVKAACKRSKSGNYKISNSGGERKNYLPSRHDICAFLRIRAHYLDKQIKRFCEERIETVNKQIAQLYRYYLFIISHLLIRHPYKQYG